MGRRDRGRWEGRGRRSRRRGGGIETEGIYEIIVGWCQVLPPIYSI